MTLNSCAGLSKLNLKEEIDEPVCVEFNLEKGGCVKIVSGDKFIVDETHLYEGKTWFEMRPYMIQMPPGTYKKFKAFIIKICKKYKCDKDVASWDRALVNIDEQIKTKGEK